MKKKETKEEVQDILGTLVVLNRGNFVVDAGREFHALTEAIKNLSGKKGGRLVISLDVIPSGWSESDGRCNQVEIKPKITVTAPKKEQGKSIFFLSDEGKLTRDDPEQEQMFKEAEVEADAGR